MQIRFVSKLAIGLAAFSLAACNSSSQVTPGGQICPEGYNPVANKIPGMKPIPTDPQENKSLPKESQMKPGTYTYVAGDIIYFEKDKKDPLKIHFRDFAASGVSARQTIYCTENGGLNMQVPKTEADAVTDVIVCNDYRQIVRSRKFKWEVKDGRIEFKAPDYNVGTAWCTDSAQKVYDKDVGSFVKIDEANYEARSTRSVGPGYFDLVTRMAYAPFPKSPQFPNGAEAKDCLQCVPIEKPPTTPKNNPTPINKDQTSNRR